MGTVQLSSAKDLVVQAGSALAEMRRDLLQKLATDTKAQIQDNSRGQLVGELNFIPDGFVIGEPLTKDDPKGEKVMTVERATNAYARTRGRLSDKAYVASVIDRI